MMAQGLLPSYLSSSPLISKLPRCHLPVPMLRWCVSCRPSSRMVLQCRWTNWTRLCKRAVHALSCRCHAKGLHTCTCSCKHVFVDCVLVDSYFPGPPAVYMCVQHLQRWAAVLYNTSCAGFLAYISTVGSTELRVRHP